MQFMKQMDVKNVKIYFSLGFFLYSVAKICFMGLIIKWLNRV